MRIWRVAGAALLALAMVSCGAQGSGGAGSVSVDEKDNGHTVRVPVGATVTLVLHNTYWRLSPVPAGGVLRATAEPRYSAPPPGKGCVPGGGCGTVTASFSADRAGAATVVATRTSCGEARGCSPDQARYAVVVIVGNGDPSPAVVTAVSSPATAGPSVATAAPPPGPSSSSTVVATDADNGGSVTLATGELLTVRLASTYWHFAATGPGVLQQQGAPRVDARPPGIACVPGGGCGTVTATFRAVAPGRVQLTATRTSCGEARGCTGNQGVFRLTVVVG